MTRHKLSNDNIQTLERERSAEEFFDRFPEEYQQSRDSIRKLVELLRKRLEEAHLGDDDDDIPAQDVYRCPEDVHHVHRCPRHE